MKNFTINALKPAFIRVDKFAMAFIALVSCIALSTFTLNAQTGSPAEQSLSFNQDYFKQITYHWTDENGVTHLSNLAEPATEYNQIIEFIREVYLNPAVPGFRKDYAWEKLMASSGVSDIDPGYENNYVEVPYRPCLAEGNPYGMDKNTVVTPPIEGTTALMVELVDDYEYKQGDDCEALIKKIKRITLLTEQRYVDETVSENPGTLFNYVGSLNNFFLVTKGNNRIPKDEKSKEGFPPFYNMFEEYSPSNSLPIYGAFADMNSGHGFSIDHNCTSIMTQNHIIVMSPEPAKDKPIDEELYHDFGVNFMFFLPDLRFARDTRRHPDPSITYVGEWYTYYSADHQPYFFFNKIKASIGKDPEITVDADGKNVAKVKVSWYSTYNDIVHYDANEVFYVYRVVNDVIEEEPLNLQELVNENKCEIIEPSVYTLEDDGAITTKIKQISVVFNEPCDRFAYDVSYIITGRRYLTDFELTESNIVSNNIPGQVDPPGALNIVIEGSRTSEHKIAERRNHYTHTIKMLDSDPNYNNIDNVTLAKKHLRGTNEQDVQQGTTFRLMRYVGESKELATDSKHIATLEITDAFKDQWNQWEFEYVITDAATGKTYSDLRAELDAGAGAPADSLLYRLPEKCIFKTKVGATEEETENALVLAPDKTNGVLATFFDKFSVDTSLGDHPDMYHYYIDYEPALLKEGQAIDYNADSNVIDFLVPHNRLKAGYVTYSREQIDDEMEYDSRLPENSRGLQFATTTNPNVDSYTIYRLANASAPVKVAKATRMPTGRLSIERATGPASALKFYSSSYKQAAPIVEVPSAALTNDEYVLVVKYTNGNTYGNRVASLSDLPRPMIKYVRVSANDEKTNGDQTKYLGWFLWYKDGYAEDQPAMMSLSDDSETFSDDSETYRHVGYRIWRKRHGNDMDEDFTSQSHSFLCQEFDRPQSAPMRANNAYYDESEGVKSEQLEDGGILHTEPFRAHEPSKENPVNYQSHIRLYTQLPEEMSISETSDPGYAVSDANDNFSLTTYRLMTTGIESLENDDANAPVEYFNLQGQRITTPVPGNIVIRRQGSKVSKILYR